MNVRSVFALSLTVALSACSDDPVDVAFNDTGTADVGAEEVGGADASEDATPEVEEAPTPELAAYSAGSCPALGSGSNALTSGTAERAVELYLPADTEGAPLVFFWYGAGGSGQTYEWLQPFATAYGVVIAVPRAVGTSAFEWPILTGNNTTSEVTFFDDIVACAVDQLGVDPRRLYTSGFSAGALWSSTLVMERSDVLAAAVIYSGGTGGGFVHDYSTPDVAIPILGMFGGENDEFGNGILNFKETMTDFLDNLDADSHFLIACDHGLGHTIPAGGLDWGIGFMLTHTYGMEQSPLEGNIPADLPAYCDFWPL